MPKFKSCDSCQYIGVDSSGDGFNEPYTSEPICTNKQAEDFYMKEMNLHYEEDSNASIEILHSIIGKQCSHYVHCDWDAYFKAQAEAEYEEYKRNLL